MPSVFGYWAIRGLAQPIRLLLKYNGEEFEDKRYDGHDRTSWTNEKFSLGLDFPNLPYYIDGDKKHIKITQSNAILRYIGRKYDMCGKTEEEKVIVDILENQLMDFRNGFVRLCYNNAAFEENKPAYIQSVQSSIKAFADFLGQKSYLAGDNAFLDRFEKLPAIAAYMSSNEFIKRPINNPIAAFA